MKIRFVYLAGKIHMNGWRKAIVPRLRDIASNLDDIFATDCAGTVIEDLYVTGPFFISCDHGCYHGEGSHGVGADGDGCDGSGVPCTGTGIPEDVVPKVCMNQIERSNFVFAFIDDNTCFGTLCEIGYAIGKGIPVAVMFSTDKLRNSMWFVSQMADIEFAKDGYLLKSNANDPLINRASIEIANILSLEVV